MANSEQNVSEADDPGIENHNWNYFPTIVRNKRGHPMAMWSEWLSSKDKDDGAGP